MSNFSQHETFLHQETDLDEEDDRVSQRIRDLLSKRGVPIHKQGSELSSFLGVARSTIHRKFKNGGWSAAELRAVAERWRGDLEELLGGSDTEAGATAVLAGVTAEVMIPGMPSPAQLVPGPELEADDACDLVAVNPAGQWGVYTGGSEPHGTARYSVLKLVFTATPRLKIALLEDDKLAADALAEELVELGGVVVQKFHRAEDLISALKTRRFDAYVVDWLLGGGATAEPAILAIRERQKNAPVVVTTGAMALQADAEQQLIPFCERHRAGIIEKKFRAAVLLAHLRRDLLNASR